MSKVYFIGDLHLGHKSICKFSGALRGGCTTIEEHDAWIMEQWNSTVNKNDLIYVMGDVAFDKDRLPLLKRMKGNKHLILGNHDKFSLNHYKPFFNKIHGFEKYKGKAWLSHAPIHPGSLRDLWNIHGHLHSSGLDDSRYVCVSVEALNGKPISWDEIVHKQFMLVADRVMEKHHDTFERLK